MSKPIIKWVGGKRQLLDDLKALMPKKYNRYIEPFIGGGALFFEIKPQSGIICDFNNELINLYEVVRDKPNELIEDMSEHKNRSEYYYEIRALDRDEAVFKNMGAVKKASRFLFLNKTGFNGLYRVNQKNQCNVPFGRYKNPKYFDSDNIFACSEVLKKTEIFHGDFETIKNKINKGDFVYFDPPYVPLSATASFTGYTSVGFDEDMQFRLKEFCDYIDSIGAFFMLSNSYCDFILELYNMYNIHIIEAKRSINCKGNGRGKVKEVVVRNYE